jgi:antitoxin ParD1/3/4
MSLTVILPESLQAYVESQIAQGVYVNVNEYFQSLVRQDQERQDQERQDQERQDQAKLESMLLDGDDSGDGSEVTAEFWQGLKAEIVQPGHPASV